jgi:hypothetical protein
MKKLRRENPNNRKNKVVVIVQQGRKSDIYIYKKKNRDRQQPRTYRKGIYEGGESHVRN